MRRVGTADELELMVQSVAQKVAVAVAEALHEVFHLKIAGWRCPYHGTMGALGCKACRPLYEIEMPEDAEIRVSLPNLRQAS